MNKEKIIQQFSRILDRLTQECQHTHDRPTRQGRFDRQLFSGNSTTLKGCVAEIRHNLHQLQQIDPQHQATVQWLLEKITHQCQALQRELAAPLLRQAVPLTETEYWQQRYQEHRGYEARLCEMLRQHEQQMAQAETLVQQQAIAEKINILEQRLARCRTALKESHWQSTLRT